MKMLEFIDDNILENKNVLVKDINRNELFCSSKFGKKKFDTRIPLKITDDMAFIAGIIVGDGHLHKNKTGGRMIEISMINRKIMTAVKDSIEKTFGIAVKLKVLRDKSGLRKDLFRINFSNFIAWSLFNKVFEIPDGKKSKKVKMPNCIKNDLGLSKMFFSGLFLADGGMKHNSISFTTTSRMLFKDVQIFLGKMNILFTTRIWRHTGGTLVFDLIINRKTQKDAFLKMFPILTMKFAGVA